MRDKTNVEKEAKKEGQKIRRKTTKISMIGGNGHHGPVNNKENAP